jgi:glycosyltransferase involved in cell wall biosynthesis
VFAGNLAAYQGVEHLFEAFGIVLQKRPEARLKLITDSGLGRLGGLADSLGIVPNMDVVHAGFDQLPAQLRAADIAVNPRVECDGVPQKLMNYMAAARPTVSFAGSAAHLRHGETGWWSRAETSTRLPKESCT